MRQKMAGFRAAFLLSLAWAAVWATIAVVVGLILDPDGSWDEMWPAIGAYPGFLSGAVYSVSRGVAERGRAPAEVPLARVAAWGALAGLLVGVLPFTIGEATPEIPLWLLAALVIGSFTLMSALSAVATARVVEHRRAATGAAGRV